VRGDVVKVFWLTEEVSFTDGDRFAQRAHQVWITLDCSLQHFFFARMFGLE